MAFIGRRWDDGMFAVMEIENTTLKPLRNAKIIVEECTKSRHFNAIIRLLVLQRVHVLLEADRGCRQS